LIGKWDSLVNKKEFNKTKDWSSIDQEFFKKCNDHYGITDYSFLQILLNGVKDLKGSRSLFKRLDKFDNEQIGDLLAELNYIHLFRNCRWTVEIIPASSNGRSPDLKVTSNNFTASIEIKHIRFRNPGPSSVKIEELNLLEEYGNFRIDERTIRHKIFKALDQIYFYSARNPKEIPIIALWSSDRDIEELEVDHSLNPIIKEIKEEKPDFPNGLLIFSNGWLYRGKLFLPYPIHISDVFNQDIKEIADKICSFH